MKRIALMACLVLGLFGAVPSQAADCSLGGGDASDPQIVDPVNDFDGAVFGNGNGLPPYGDVYREGTDLTDLWMDAATGTPGANSFTAKVHIGVANLAGIEFNATYYFLWDNVDDPNTAVDDTYIDRYVSARVTERGALVEERGHTAPGTGGVTTITPDGPITGGSFTTGPGGGFVIPAPLWRMGKIQPGAELTGITGETRVLLGANAAGGLLGIADDTANADPTCESIFV